MIKFFKKIIKSVWPPLEPNTPPSGNWRPPPPPPGPPMASFHRAEREKKLRKKHPALKEAWEKYQVLLKLYDDPGRIRKSQENLRNKYPTLQDAWEKYQVLLKICQTAKPNKENIPVADTLTGKITINASLK